jgi:hypothetical protein
MSTERTCDGCGEVRPCKPWNGWWCADCFPEGVRLTRAERRSFRVRVHWHRRAP